nr:hypothetical protein [Tanacetum cinerariifolium]
MPTEASEPAESPSLDAKLALTNSETESDNEVPKINIGDQNEGQAEPNLGIQDEGQAGPNPGVQDEGQAGSNLGDAVGSQPQPSHLDPLRPNLEPIDLEATDASPLQNPKGLVNGLSPHSSIHFLATTSTVMTTTTIPLPPPQPQQSTTDLTLMKYIDELKQHMANLLQYNLALEERLDKHGSRLYKLENLNIPHQVSKAVDEIVTDAVDWAISRGSSSEEKKETRHTKNSFWVTTTTTTTPTSSSRQCSRYESAIVSGTQKLSPMDSSIQDDSIPDEQIHLFDDEDFENDHLPKADSRKDWWKLLPEEERSVTLNLLGPFLLSMNQMLRTTRLLHWLQLM